MSRKPLPWKTLSSKYLVQDKWLSLRIDDCRTGEGVEVNPYYIIECPDWALIAAFDEEMRLLVVEQYRHGLGRTTYELPGGIVDAEDNSLGRSIERELLEETGCKAEQIVPLLSLSPNPATHTNKAHMFMGLGCHSVGEKRLDAAEDIEHHFLPLAEVFDLIQKGSFQQPNHICCIFLALQEAQKLKISGL